MKWVFLVSFAGFLAIQAPQGLFSPTAITWGWTLLATSSMGLIGMSLRSGSPAFRLFSLRPLRFLGRYSYGFYLWHAVWIEAWIQVLIFMTRHLHSTAFGGLVTLPLCFASILLVSKLSYDLFEVKFLKLKRHFEYDSELATHRTAFAPDGN